MRSKILKLNKGSGKVYEQTILGKFKWGRHERCLNCASKQRNKGCVEKFSFLNSKAAEHGKT